MTYRVNRALGYESWGVTNPFVFANYGQPQRHRGYVSPMVFQTHPPQLKNPHLGQADLAEEDRRRNKRMEWVAVASLAVSVWSLWMFRETMKEPTRVAANRRFKRVFWSIPGVGEGEARTIRAAKSAMAARRGHVGPIYGYIVIERSDGSRERRAA